MDISVIEQHEVEMLHEMILRFSPGRPGILHPDQLEAALQRPFTYAQYESVNIHTLAALMIDSFARNHAFNDGNKRTAIMSAIYTYAINDVFLTLNDGSNKDFEELVLWVVKDKPNINTIEKKLKSLVKIYELSDFKKFKLSLRSFFKGYKA